MFQTATVGRRKPSRAIVLAAGEGGRMCTLTQSASVPAPRQFCSLCRRRSGPLICVIAPTGAAGHFPWARR